MGVYEIYKYESEESEESEMISRVVVDCNDTGLETKDKYAIKHKLKPADLIIVDVTSWYNECISCEGEGNQNHIWATDTPEYAANLACDLCEGSGIENKAVETFDRILEFNTQRLKEVQGYE